MWGRREKRGKKREGRGKRRKKGERRREEGGERKGASVPLLGKISFVNARVFASSSTPNNLGNFLLGLQERRGDSSS